MKFLFLFLLLFGAALLIQAKPIEQNSAILMFGDPNYTGQSSGGGSTTYLLGESGEKQLGESGEHQLSE